MKLYYDEPLSNLAFSFNLRHYNLGSLRPPVAHRDVKPGNVVLERATGMVSLVDFGATADAAVTAALSDMGGGGGGGRGFNTLVHLLANVSAFRGVQGAFRGCSGGV